MEKKIAPSEHKAQALRAVLQGQAEGQSGEELLSLLVRLSTERILQEALEEEQAGALAFMTWGVATTDEKGAGAR